METLQAQIQTVLINKQAYLNRITKKFTNQYHIDTDLEDLKQTAQLKLIKRLTNYPKQIKNQTAIDSCLRDGILNQLKQIQKRNAHEVVTSPFNLNRFNLIDYHRVDTDLNTEELKRTMDNYAENSKYEQHFNILINNYAMFGNHPHTLNQLAKFYHVNNESIRQKRNIALRELRQAETQTGHYVKYLLRTQTQMPDKY